MQMYPLKIDPAKIDEIKELFAMDEETARTLEEIANILQKEGVDLPKIVERAAGGMKMAQKRKFEKLSSDFASAMGEYLMDSLENPMDQSRVAKCIDLAYRFMEAGFEPYEVIALLTRIFEELTDKTGRIGEDLRRRIRALDRFVAINILLINRSYAHEERNRYAKLAQTYRTVLNAMHDGMVVVNADTDKIVEVNRRIEAMTGLSRGELIDREVYILHPAEFGKIVRKTLLEAKKERFGLIPEIYLFNRENDEYIPVEATYSFYELDDEKFIVIVVRDITDRLSTQVKLARLNRLYRVLSAVNEQIIRIHTKEELYRKICKIIVEEGGFKFAWIAELENEHVVKPIAYSDTSYFYENIKTKIESPEKKDVAEIVKKLKKEGYSRNGHISEEEGEKLTIPIWHDREKIGIALHSGSEIRAVLKVYSIEAGEFSDEEIRLFQEIADDISYAVTTIEHREKIEFLTNFDLLTQLPNRHLFKAKLDMAVQSANYKKEVFAVVLVDIDQFKHINDTYGFGFGDQLIVEVAEHLRRVVRPHDELARYGSDEFALIFFDIKNEEQIIEFADKISRISHRPLLIEETEIYVSLSVGIALFPRDSHAPEDLMTAAESALAEARRQGGNCYIFYSEEMNSTVQSRIRLQNELYKAYENGEFELYYQPQVECRSEKIVGVEALLRWNHPQKGLIAPGGFIPVLEESSLIEKVGTWVIEEACRQIRRWNESPSKIDIPVSVAVNISAKQISRDPLFFEKLLKIIEKAGIDPAMLHIEITESIIMTNLEAIEKGLNLLKKEGVLTVIDDFGTGYSSLSYLKRLPSYALKIDRSFIKGLPDDNDDIAIVDAIIAMAGSLGKKTIAEGVETKEQLEFLKKRPCDMIQGFYFAKPMPATEFEKFYTNFRKRG